MLITPKRFRSICLLLLVAALGVRLAGLADKTFNIDEVVARRIGLNFNRETLEGRPPLSFVLIAGTLQIQDSPTMLLLPAALFGAATVGLLGWAGRVAFGWRVGLIAALWLLFSPLHVAYSHYARYYSFMIFFSVLSYLYLDLWLRMRRWRYLAYWTVPSALNLATHFFAAFVVGIQGGLILVVLVLYAGRAIFALKKRRALTLALAASAILVGIVAAPIAYSLAGIDKFIASQTSEQRSGLDISWAFWEPYLVELSGWPRGLLPAVLGLAGVGLIRAWRRNKLFVFHTPALLILPIFVVDLLKPRHRFEIRYVSFALPFLLMALAAGVETLWELAVRRLPRSAFYRRPVEVVAWSVVVCAPLLVFISYVREPVLREHHDIERFLRRVTRPNDAVLLVHRDDWHELNYIVSPAIREKLQRWTTWDAIRNTHVPRRLARPFWLVVGRTHHHARDDMEWAFNTFSHQAFQWGYVFYCMKHIELNLSDPAMGATRREIPADVSPQISAEKQAFRFSLYVPRSYHYYLLSSIEMPGFLARLEGVRPVRWVHPAVNPSAERQKIWIAEGRHDLTLLAPKGTIGNLANLRLSFLPACGDRYEVNAGQFDLAPGHTVLDRAVTYQDRFGIEMYMWGYLYFPVFVETAGKYRFSVTADNDRPTTNRLRLWLGKLPGHDFYFNQCDNSIETQSTVIDLAGGRQLVGLRNEWYKGVDEVRRGQVPDRTKTTFIEKIALEAVEKPPESSR